MKRKWWPAYAASFEAGFQQALRNRTDLVSVLVVYAVLLVIFWSIYSIMPIGELGMPGLTREKLLAYFAMTEAVIVSGTGLARFGQMISEGRLTEMMQRPTGILPMILARQMGTHLGQAMVILVLGFLLMPVLTGHWVALDWRLLPFLALSFLMGCLLMEVMAYMLGTLEVLGPYSRPSGWIISKFIFTFGGLFFPVILFPPMLQTVARFTPFPSVIFVPGSFLLGLSTSRLLLGVLEQAVWLAAMLAAAVVAERLMLRRVLEKGE